MKRITFARLAGLLMTGLLIDSCADAIPTVQRVADLPAFDAQPGPPVLDQKNGTLGFTGTDIRKGFNPHNPQLGDAIIATFIWQGPTTNVITSVTDVLSDGTTVGNTYNLVEFKSAGPISMATYVALNVQNFPQGNPSDPNPNQDKILVVVASLSEPITNGGIMLSAYRGVATAGALTGHASAGGTSSTTTVASTGPITPGDGALVYSVSYASPIAGQSTPAGFNDVTSLSTADGSTIIIGKWAVHSGSGTSDPQWTWNFTEPSSWVLTNVALLPNGGGGPPIGDLTATTSTSGSNLDPDGYSVTVDGGESQAIGINDSVTFTGLPSGDHSVALAGVAPNCTVDGSNPRTISVPAGGRANTAFSVTCAAPPNQAPVVNAGPDETVLLGLLFTENWSFADPDNGPWSFTIDWGDGTYSSGTKTSAGSFSNAHTYGGLLLGTFTIRITVTDSQGATHTDTKQVTVVLL